MDLSVSPTGFDDGDALRGSPLNIDWAAIELDTTAKDSDDAPLAFPEPNFEAPARSAKEGEPRKKNRGGTAPLRRKKKPRGLPKRPLSSYNLYFQKERSRIVEQEELTLAMGGSRVDKLTFEELGKIIGRRWKELGEVERKSFDELAEQDSDRYRREMDAFNEQKRVARKRKTDSLDMGLRKGNEILFNDKELRPVPGASFPEHLSSPVRARLPGSVPSPGHLAPFNGPVPTLAQLQVGSTHWQPIWPPSGLPPRDFPFPRVLQPTVNESIRAPREQCQLPNAAIQAMTQQHLPIPPGMELYLPDPSGQDRKYTVMYNFYSMTRSEAQEYMGSLEASACLHSSAPLVGPPPNTALTRTATPVMTMPVDPSNIRPSTFPHVIMHGLPPPVVGNVAR